MTGKHELLTSLLEMESNLHVELGIDSTRVLGVREGKVYRLQGMPVDQSKGILDHGSMSMTEDEEQEAPKGEQSSQTSSVGS
jgi:hypothetical protein